MLLTKIYLSHFRNFTQSEFTFSPFLTLIIGENAHGKTSLLESIYTAVSGTGYRESRELELIEWDAEQALIESTFTDRDTRTMYQIQLLKKENDRVEKNFYVNKTHKSWFQYKDLQTRAVLFAPEHISLVSGSPVRRRDYFDVVISEFDREYRKSLRNYMTALRKRNKVLELHLDEVHLKSEIQFWNEYLLKEATYITKTRTNYMEYLNKHPTVDGKTFRIEYIKNEFSERRLHAVYAQERRMRKTQIGPQKDDFVFYLQGDREKNVHFYGSRSEQRLAVFWLKLNEIQYYEQVLKKRPILLLDDVFSELDVHNKELVMRVVREYQTVITTTENEAQDLAEVPEVTIRL